MKHLLSLIMLFSAMQLSAQDTRVWQADLGNGKFRNPIIHADYSDPDLIRVGDDYWMTSSSFNCAPGLQILHSTDLVNWTIVNTVFTIQEPRETFDKLQHGNGVFAPCIKYHNGVYYIYWGDPDFGIYMVSTTDPEGEWSKPHMVIEGQGLIDPSPLWDDDGRAYLVHAWAGSRAGMNSILSVMEMSPDGKSIIGEEVLIFDGHDGHLVVEGPKFYKRNGYYYVFAPAGGVQTGWQLVLRSESVYGPYEHRVVMHQGDTNINGPHQGGWVDDIAGNSWFVHFQDIRAYGRVVHLQPMVWGDDNWCVIGEDLDNDGCGTPVSQWVKPATRVATTITEPATSDEFDGNTLGLQWQWHANPQIWWAMPCPSFSTLRINSRKVDEPWRNHWDTPNLLLQKFPALKFTATTKLNVSPSYSSERFGMIVMGLDYATIELTYDGESLTLEQRECIGAEGGSSESINATTPFAGGDIYMRCVVTEGAECQFQYSLNGKKFINFGAPFTAKVGKWIGAKIGFFATSEFKKNNSGRMDVDWFRVER